MTILFSLVARGATILAKHATCAGNFIEVIEQVLVKITPETSKLTYSHGNYLFHYITEAGITYLCITDDDFERSKAFAFLGEIKKRFQNQYGTRAETALPYAMNSDFSKVLSAQMRFYSSNTGNLDKVTAVQEQVNDLKTIMVKNIDDVARRGERLELLIDKTEDLSASSVTFKRSSHNLARSLWWKNVKITIIAVLVAIVILYFIVSIACGGLDWKKCVKKK